MVKINPEKLKCFSAFAISLLLLFLISCSGNKSLTKDDALTLPNIEDLQDFKDDHANYVYLNGDEDVVFNKVKIGHSDICQSLLTQQAFHWSIVLSPSKTTSKERLDKSENTIRECYEKYLMVMAVDMYDKAMSQLSAESQKMVRDLHTLDLIITAPRKEKAN